MKMLLCLLLSMMFIHQPCVVCGKTCVQEHVSAADGGEVILRVPQSENSLINWVLFPSGTFVATTEPGKPINEKALRIEYRGRVSSEDDGSLHIYHLSLKDQGVYKAETTDDKICVQFNLTVYERLSSGDIKINHNLTRNDNCSLLCTVDKRDVTITWSTVQSGHINVTRGVLYVPPSDVNLTYTCTARNPVSNVSKTVIPGEYCRKDSSLTRQNQKDLGTLYMIRWVLSGVVLLITCCVFIHHVKSEVIKPSGRC